MKRRTFIKGTTLTGTGIIAGMPVSAISNSSLASLINGDSDRVLVLVQLNGGNDGLAMIIPRDQQSNLAKARENILVPENTFLNITDTVALHPRMGGLRELYDDAKLKVVQSVGYPDQNRSHFRSQDIWHTGSHADEFLATGWLGRFMDQQFPGFPESYPNADCPDPFAITIGSTVSETCQGEAGNFSMAIVDPQNLNQLASPINNEIAEGCGSSNLDFLITAIEQTNEYSEVITEAYEKGSNISSLYDNSGVLAEKLKIVARLISGGLRSKIYIVNLGSFDTHANQVVEGQTEEGNHAGLLSELSMGIAAFQDDLNKLGLEERVMGMTYSEFGRRIRSNFSFGTDHGTAAPLLLFGACVNAGITGDNPEISDQVEVNEGVPMQYDFRSVYGSLLIDWFDLEEEQVREIFTHDFQYVQLGTQCNTTSTEDPSALKVKVQAYPNPFKTNFEIRLRTKREWVKISLFDSIGMEVRVLSNQLFTEGEHTMRVEAQDLSSGVYFIRVQSKLGQKTLRIVKG